MIAGIVSFVALATSVAFAYPCGETLVYNRVSGSSLNGGVLAEVRPSCSNVVATPSSVSSLFTPSTCNVCAPASQPFNGLAAPEVISTEAAVPEYSTLVAPSTSSSTCGGSVSSGVASSLLLPSLSTSQVVSSGCGSSVFGSSGVVSRPVSATIVSAPVVEQTNVATPMVTVGQVNTRPAFVETPTFTVGQVSTRPAFVETPTFTVGQVSTRPAFVEAPAVTVVASRAPAQLLGSSEVVSRPASATIVSAPVVEQTNVATPMVTVGQVNTRPAFVETPTFTVGQVSTRPAFVETPAITVGQVSSGSFLNGINY